MKLTIIAATGGVGRQVLRQARHAGHDVTPWPATPPSSRRRSWLPGPRVSSPPTSPAQARRRWSPRWPGPEIPPVVPPSGDAPRARCS